MKPRVKVFSAGGCSWYSWKGRGVWRICVGDLPHTWTDMYSDHQVPYMGY